MATLWVELRVGLESHLCVLRIAQRLRLTPEATVFHLYRLAGWFARHGKYGKLKADAALVDAFLGVPGFADELAGLNWLDSHDTGVLTLRWFCTISATRKRLGKKVRQKILGTGVCAVCGQPGDLEIDHKTPISRGGSCDDDNLQPLCVGCNRRKGKKTMGEFTGGQG